MGYSYKKDSNIERKEWFKRLYRYIKEEESKGNEFYCFSLMMNDYRRFKDCNGNDKRVWGNRNDYENGLRFFYNKLNEKLYGGNWKRKKKVVDGEKVNLGDKGIRYLKNMNKMNEVRNGHFHIIIKKEKDISEIKLRECIKNIWLFNNNRWNRKFEGGRLELFDWEKYCWMENGYEDEDGKMVRWRDSYLRDVYVNRFEVSNSCFKFDRLYFNRKNDVDYSYLNYCFKGRWKKKEDYSFDVCDSLRKYEVEKFSIMNCILE
jgi:hypothetical protein